MLVTHHTRLLSPLKFVMAQACVVATRHTALNAKLWLAATSDQHKLMNTPEFPKTFISSVQPQQTQLKGHAAVAVAATLSQLYNLTLAGKARDTELQVS